MFMKRITGRLWVAVLLAALAIGVALAFSWQGNRYLLIAPMIGGLNACIFNKKQLVHDTPSSTYTQLCVEDEASASGLINATLAQISKNKEQVGNYQLGYTLYVPLLKLFDVDSGEYKINKDAIGRVVQSINHVERPVILYLFSDHFEVGSKMEELLAKNNENRLYSKHGVIPLDTYYGSKIYPWAFTNTANELTHLREIAVNAVLDEVCLLPRDVQKRVAGVTMLGELHHMFPDFQGGMGFSGDYVISDYSAQSVQDFTTYLGKRYGSIWRLNNYLGSSFKSFEQVKPPAKDIRKDPLKHYWEHLDAYAHGVLPISGWVADRTVGPHDKSWVQLYDNGKFLARVPVAFGRQDVLLAHPELASSDVGWQFNWRYADAPPGLHTIEVLLERGSGPMVRLASRKIAIMERSQAAPGELPVHPLPKTVDASTDILSQVDNPKDQMSYYYNPLAVVWHDFRRQQVTKYLEHFAKIAQSKCIDSDRVYSHQILPFVNPGWDETKFGVGRDLAVPANMALGVSLYGEASYGTSFFDWINESNRRAYGITEFHPLKAMSPAELAFVFDRHYQRNASFLSFFVESVGLSEDPESKPNIFSFDKHNKNAGSDTLYESVKNILQ